MAKKKFDPKAKAKRQKVILAVGGVILLGLLVIQVPKTMKMMKGQSQSASSSSPPPATSTTAGSNPLAPPSLDGSTGATASSGAETGSSAATSADGVTDPSNPLTPNAGQLVSFSKFKSKDPFHQQIALGCQSDQVSGAPATCTSAPTSTMKKSAASPVTGTQLIAGGSKPVAAKPQTATISVNGAATTVTIGSLFPADGTPVFTLVSLTTSAARIGIAGGSYESGATTVVLKKGKTVTLVNTADGTRYALRLVAAK
jgi:hypothetical protein